MIYKKSKSGGGGGAWVKASEVKSGTKAKLVSEAEPMEGEYGTQDVAKIRVDGDPDTKNVRLNKPTIAGLIDAFGDDSKEWINKELTIHTEKMVIAGKRVTALYLLAEGCELGEDGGGFLVVVNKGKAVKSMGEDIPVIEEDMPDPEDMPF